MKLSNPTAIKSAALLVSGVLRAWLGTLDMRFAFDSETSDPLRTRRPTVFLFWHEMILLPAYAYTRFRIAPLISRHRDGELIAQVVRMLRGVSVRGSTDRGKNRGGMSAVRTMMRLGRAQHLTITPDGPRGPRREVQDGVIFLASRTGMPLVPSGLAFENPWRVGSWDKMALPRPFSRARCVAGLPIEVPANLDRSDMDGWRRRVQEAMDDAQERAERLAAGHDAGVALMTKSEALSWP